MWSPQRYIRIGKKKGRTDALLRRASEQIEQVLGLNADVPAILSLNHLADRVGVSYGSLRWMVMRHHVPYRHFLIRKRSGGRRVIRVPEPMLMRVQRWLAAHVLNPQRVHKSSHAFQPKSSIVKCAARHCGAKWMVKMDIAGFFHGISEIQVYRIFREIGYEKLVAFELARLTTYLPGPPLYHRGDQWKATTDYKAIPEYSNRRIGFLPQGAPTSPMLSNLAMREVDAEIEKVARKTSLTYTRYSDDLTFSTRDDDFDRRRANRLIVEVTRILAEVGLYPQSKKTVIVPPGARKIVLGLLVDGDEPNLPREFRDRMRMHLHFLEKFGPVEHAKTRGFDTVWGMKSHIRGLIDYAKMVDKDYANELLKRFEAVVWPI